MAQTIGLRQQVKKGLISAREALEQIQQSAFKSPTIVGWLRSRIDRGITVTPPTPATPEEKPASNSEAKRLKIQQKK